MRTIVKNIIHLFPSFLQRWIFDLIEFYYSPRIPRAKKTLRVPGKKNILFYHISGLSFGGTEKFLQILAKYSNKGKYNVFFMYSSQPRGADLSKKMNGRLSYLKESGVTLIECSYGHMEQKFPYNISGVEPHILKVISDNNIALFITAGSGYAEFPINTIRTVPIILINIFGSPIRQKNVVKNICISYAVKEKTDPITRKETLEVMYIPSEGPDIEAVLRGKELRQKLNIPDNAFVCGRIGRPDNRIFDPIGINAFKKVVKEDRTVHYLIVSPPPALVKIVSDEHIPNVHFVPPVSEEKDIWAFHAAIDCLAHFRLDGESCGLNIIEAMLSKKPVISHKSKQWNAHLEYLDSEFSRVAEIDDSEKYAEYIREFAKEKQSKALQKMGEAAHAKARDIALIDTQIIRFESWVDEIK